MRNEASKTLIRRFGFTDSAELAAELRALARTAGDALLDSGIPAEAQTPSYQVDLRYHGQGLTLTVALAAAELDDALVHIGPRFDALHEQLFTFALPVEKEVVNLRAVVEGDAPVIAPVRLAAGDEDARAAIYAHQAVRMDGTALTAPVYNRALLLAGNRLPGPAIVTEMDSTTVILPGHCAEVDPFGNLLIRPV